VKETVGTISLACVCKIYFCGSCSYIPKWYMIER